MLSDLSKLFDRNFALGFFLPVAAFVAASLALLNELGYSAVVLPVLKADILLGATVLALGSWLGAVLLLGLNRDLIRLLEGYGRWNPARLWAGLERRRYRQLHQEVAALDDEYRRGAETGAALPPERRDRRAALMRQAAEQFPDDERWLLPTRFGNAVRAFEVYPRALYGLDPIQGWSRLLAVVPKDFRELVDSAKAQVDFWVNVRALAALFVAEYAALAYYEWTLPAPWAAAAGLALVALAAARAQSAVAEWGDQVKAAFDVFVPQLYAKLGVPIPKTREEERALWRAYSQAMIYRLPNALPEPARPEKPPSPPPSARNGLPWWRRLLAAEEAPPEANRPTGR